MNNDWISKATTDIEVALDDYDHSRQVICDYFGLNCYPVLYTDVYWRIKTKQNYKMPPGHMCECLEFQEELPTGDNDDKYYIHYSEELEESSEIKTKENYTVVKLRDEGWIILDNKKKV